MSPHLPMVYVEEPIRWQYKQVARRLEKEKLPTEEELHIVTVTTVIRILTFHLHCAADGGICLDCSLNSRFQF